MCGNLCDRKSRRTHVDSSDDFVFETQPIVLTSPPRRIPPRFSRAGTSSARSESWNGTTSTGQCERATNAPDTVPSSRLASRLRPRCADDCQTRVAAGFGEDFSRVSPRWLRRMPRRLRSVPVRQILRAVPASNSRCCGGDRRRSSGRAGVGSPGHCRHSTTRIEQLCSCAMVTAVVNAWRLLSDPSTPIKISAGGRVKRAMIASPYAKCPVPERGTSPRQLPRPTRHSARARPRLGCVRTQSAESLSFANRTKYISTSTTNHSIRVRHLLQRMPLDEPLDRHLKLLTRAGVGGSPGTAMMSSGTCRGDALDRRS